MNLNTPTRFWGAGVSLLDESIQEDDAGIVHTACSPSLDVPVLAVTSAANSSTAGGATPVGSNADASRPLSSSRNQQQGNIPQSLGSSGNGGKVLSQVALARAEHAETARRHREFVRSHDASSGTPSLGSVSAGGASGTITQPRASNSASSAFTARGGAARVGRGGGGGISSPPNSLMTPSTARTVSLYNAELDALLADSPPPLRLDMLLGGGESPSNASSRVRGGKLSDEGSSSAAYVPPLQSFPGNHLDGTKTAADEEVAGGRASSDVDPSESVFEVGAPSSSRLRGSPPFSAQDLTTNLGLVPSSSSSSSASSTSSTSSSSMSASALFSASSVFSKTLNPMSITAIGPFDSSLRSSPSEAALLLSLPSAKEEGEEGEGGRIDDDLVRSTPPTSGAGGNATASPSTSQVESTTSPFAPLPASVARDMPSSRKTPAPSPASSHAPAAAPASADGADVEIGAWNVSPLSQASSVGGESPRSTLNECERLLSVKGSRDPVIKAASSSGSHSSSSSSSSSSAAAGVSVVASSPVVTSPLISAIDAVAEGSADTTAVLVNDADPASLPASITPQTASGSAIHLLSTARAAPTSSGAPSTLLHQPFFSPTSLLPLSTPSTAALLAAGLPANAQIFAGEAAAALLDRSLLFAPDAMARLFSSEDTMSQVLAASGGSGGGGSSTSWGDDDDACYEEDEEEDGVGEGAGGNESRWEGADGHSISSHTTHSSLASLTSAAWALGGEMSRDLYAPPLASFSSSPSPVSHREAPSATSGGDLESLHAADDRHSEDEGEDARFNASQVSIIDADSGVSSAASIAALSFSHDLSNTAILELQQASGILRLGASQVGHLDATSTSVVLTNGLIAADATASTAATANASSSHMRAQNVSSPPPLPSSASTSMASIPGGEEAADVENTRNATWDSDSLNSDAWEAEAASPILEGGGGGDATIIAEAASPLAANDFSGRGVSAVSQAVNSSPKFAPIGGAAAAAAKDIGKKSTLPPNSPWLGGILNNSSYTTDDDSTGEAHAPSSGTSPVAAASAAASPISPSGGGGASPSKAIAWSLDMTVNKSAKAPTLSSSFTRSPSSLASTPLPMALSPLNTAALAGAPGVSHSNDSLPTGLRRAQAPSFSSPPLTSLAPTVPSSTSASHPETNRDGAALSFTTTPTHPLTFSSVKVEVGEEGVANASGSISNVLESQRSAGDNLSYNAGQGVDDGDISTGLSESQISAMIKGGRSGAEGATLATAPTAAKSGIYQAAATAAAAGGKRGDPLSLRQLYATSIIPQGSPAAAIATGLVTEEDESAPGGSLLSDFGFTRSSLTQTMEGFASNGIAGAIETAPMQGAIDINTQHLLLHQPLNYTAFFTQGEENSALCRSNFGIERSAAKSSSISGSRRRRFSTGSIQMSSSSSAASSISVITSSLTRQVNTSEDNQNSNNATSSSKVSQSSTLTTPGRQAVEGNSVGESSSQPSAAAETKEKNTTTPPRSSSAAPTAASRRRALGTPQKASSSGIPAIATKQALPVEGGFGTTRGSAIAAVATSSSTSSADKRPQPSPTALPPFSVILSSSNSASTATSLPAAGIAASLSPDSASSPITRVVSSKNDSPSGAPQSKNSLSLQVPACYAALSFSMPSQEGSSSLPILKWAPGGALPILKWAPGGALPILKWAPGGALPILKWAPGGACTLETTQAPAATLSSSALDSTKAALEGFPLQSPAPIALPLRNAGVGFASFSCAFEHSTVSFTHILTPSDPRHPSTASSSANGSKRSSPTIKTVPLQQPPPSAVEFGAGGESYKPLSGSATTMDLPFHVSPSQVGPLPSAFVAHVIVGCGAAPLSPILGSRQALEAIFATAAAAAEGGERLTRSLVQVTFKATLIFTSRAVVSTPAATASIASEGGSALDGTAAAAKKSFSLPVIWSFAVLVECPATLPTSSTNEAVTASDRIASAIAGKAPSHAISANVGHLSGVGIGGVMSLLQRQAAAAATASADAASRRSKHLEALARPREVRDAADKKSVAISRTPSRTMAGGQPPSSVSSTSSESHNAASTATIPFASTPRKSSEGRSLTEHAVPPFPPHAAVLGSPFLARATGTIVYGARRRVIAPGASGAGVRAGATRSRSSSSSSAFAADWRSRGGAETHQQSQQRSKSSGANAPSRGSIDERVESDEGVGRSTRLPLPPSPYAKGGANIAHLMPSLRAAASKKSGGGEGAADLAHQSSAHIPALVRALKNRLRREGVEDPQIMPSSSTASSSSKQTEADNMSHATGSVVGESESDGTPTSAASYRSSSATSIVGLSPLPTQKRSAASAASIPSVSLSTVSEDAGKRGSVDISANTVASTALAQRRLLQSQKQQQQAPPAPPPTVSPLPLHPTRRSLSSAKKALTEQQLMAASTRTKLAAAEPVAASEVMIPTVLGKSSSSTSSLHALPSFGGDEQASRVSRPSKDPQPRTSRRSQQQQHLEAAYSCSVAGDSRGSGESAKSSVPTSPMPPPHLSSAPPSALSQHSFQSATDSISQELAALLAESMSPPPASFSPVSSDGSAVSSPSAARENDSGPRVSSDAADVAGATVTSNASSTNKSLTPLFSSLDSGYGSMSNSSSSRAPRTHQAPPLWYVSPLTCSVEIPDAAARVSLSIHSYSRSSSSTIGRCLGKVSFVNRGLVSIPLRLKNAERNHAATVLRLSGAATATAGNSSVSMLQLPSIPSQGSLDITIALSHPPTSSAASHACMIPLSACGGSDAIGYQQHGSEGQEETWIWHPITESLSMNLFFEKGSARGSTGEEEACSVRLVIYKVAWEAAGWTLIPSSNSGLQAYYSKLMSAPSFVLPGRSLHSPAAYLLPASVALAVAATDEKAGPMTPSSTGLTTVLDSTMTSASSLPPHPFPAGVAAGKRHILRSPQSYSTISSLSSATPASAPSSMLARAIPAETSSRVMPATPMTIAATSEADSSLFSVSTASSSSSSSALQDAAIKAGGGPSSQQLAPVKPMKTTSKIAPTLDSSYLSTASASTARGHGGGADGGSALLDTSLAAYSVASEDEGSEPSSSRLPGVYMPLRTISLPATRIDAKTRVKVQLCNTSRFPLTVRVQLLPPPSGAEAGASMQKSGVSSPSLITAFKIKKAHAEISLRPRSFCMLPITFAPTNASILEMATSPLSDAAAGPISRALLWVTALVAGEAEKGDAADSSSLDTTGGGSTVKTLCKALLIGKLQI